MSRPLLSFTTRWLCRRAGAGMLALLVAGLTACGGGGGDSGTASSDAGPPPTAAFTASANSVRAGDAVAFDARGSNSPNGTALSYAWDFGDGVRGGGAQIAHIYASAGSYTATLTVADGEGGTATATLAVTATAAAAPGPTATVTGLIDDGKAALAGVSVALVNGSAVATTDADGRVSLALPTGVPNVLRLSKPGYADQIVPVPLVDGTPGATFNAAMLAREPAQALDTAAGGTLTGKHGAALALAAGSLVDATGKPFSGTAQISVTPVDIRGGGVAQFPGSFTGVRADGSNTPIASYGSTEFVLAAGSQRLNLAPGRSAQIDLPLYALKHLNGSPVIAGDTIPLWSLDEQSGRWVHEGTGVVVASGASPTGLVMRASVSHFTWWNIDGFVDAPYHPLPRCMRNDGLGLPLVPVSCQLGTQPRPGQTPVPPGAVTPVFEERVSVSASGVISTPGNVGSLGVPPNVNVPLYACTTDAGIVACGTRTVNGASGVSEIVVIELQRATACTSAIAINAPAAVTTNLAAMDVACYDVTVAAPTTLSLGVTAAGDASMLITGTKSIRAANGTVLGSADWRVGDAADNQPVLVNVAAGTYRIEVATAEAQANQVHLLVADVGCNSTATPALPASVNLAVPGLKTACLQVPQAAGRRLVVSAQGTDAGAAGTVALRASNGALLAMRIWQGTAAVAFVQDVVADTYRVELFNTNTNAGSATVTVRSTDPALPLDCSRTLASPGTLGVPLGPIDVACATITVPAATTLTLRATAAEGSGLAGTKTLKATNGSVLATAAWTTGATDATPLSAVVNAGTYLVEIANNSAFTGTATLAANSLATGCAAPEVIASPSTRSVSLGALGVACYTVNVPGPKKLSVGLQSPVSGALNGNTVLKDANGKVVASKTWSGLTTLAQRLLPGSYRLELTNNGNAPLSFGLGLSDVDIANTTVAVPSITPLSVAFQGSQALSFTPTAGTAYVAMQNQVGSFIAPGLVADSTGTTVTYVAALLSPATADPLTMLFGSDLTLVNTQLKLAAAPTIVPGVPQTVSVTAAADLSVRHFVLDGHAGDTLALSARVPGGTSGAFPTAHLFDAGGAETGVVGGINPFRVAGDVIAVALPVTGRYRVDVEQIAKADIANATIGVAVLPAAQLLTLAGETTSISGSLAQLADAAGFSIDLAKGDLVAFAVDTVASPRLVPGLYFRQPVASGSPYLGTAQFGASSTPGQGTPGLPLTLSFVNGATFATLPVPATADGRYLAHLRGAGAASIVDLAGTTGPYTLRVFKPAARPLAVSTADTVASSPIGFTHYVFTVATAGDYRVCANNPLGTTVRQGLFDGNGQAQVATGNAATQQPVYTLVPGAYHLAVQAASSSNVTALWQPASNAPDAACH